MLQSAALKVLNHLITQTPGAEGRLAAHAGRHARLALGGAGLSFGIDGAGLLTESPGDVHAVTISLPADALLQALRQGDAALREARIEGDAALAETLGNVLRSLRWDAAEDLSRLIGDVAAERLVVTGRSVLATGNDLAGRLASSATEYVADEAQILVRPGHSHAFAAGVDTLRDDLSRLQKRIERLERTKDQPAR